MIYSQEIIELIFQLLYVVFFVEWMLTKLRSTPSHSYNFATTALSVDSALFSIIYFTIISTKLIWETITFQLSGNF